MTTFAELLDCLVSAARDAGSCDAKLARAEILRAWCNSSEVAERQRDLRAARKNSQHAEGALVHISRLVRTNMREQDYHNDLPNALAGQEIELQRATKTTDIKIRMPPALKSKMKAEAERRGVSVSEWLRWLAEREPAGDKR